MELNKITERDLEGKGVLGQPEIPGLSANEMQEKVEEIVRSVAIAKINEIIDYLKIGNATDGYFTFDVSENGLEVMWSGGN